jgi:hypothetical protein
MKHGCHFKKLVDVLEIALTKADIDPEYANRFKLYLEDSKFVACEEDIYEVPIGEWPLDASKYCQKRNDLMTGLVLTSLLCVPMHFLFLFKDERENGYLFRDLAIRRFQAMKRWFVNLGELSEQTFDNLWQMALEENEEGTSVLWRINRGRKPYNHEAGSSNMDVKK